MPLLFVRTLAVAAFCLAMAGPTLGLGGQLKVEGTDFALQLDDGRVLRGDALIGLRLILATAEGDRQVRIDGTETDETAHGGPMRLYHLSMEAPGGERRDFCQPDPHGRRAGFPEPDGAGGFSFTCTSGAEGKCILMGYRPWEQREGVPMRDLFRACIHMIRADYGGDDRPTTRNGTLIDVYDRFGIQAPDPSDTLAFEAAWSPAGAVCVAHPRIAANVGLGALAARYPRLKDRLGPNACTEDGARADPQALLFNRSAVTAP